jgi:putative ABC transport system permease protein
MYRQLVRRLRGRPFASFVGFTGIILGVALTVLLVGSYLEFHSGTYRTGSDSLASSFSVTKAQPHGTRATGVQSLSDSDVAALRRDVDPSLVSHVVPIAQGAAVIRNGDRTFHGGVTGGPSDYPSYLHTPVTAGAMFTARDVEDNARVALLGPAVAKAIFPGDPRSAVGSDITIGRVQFRVIGLLGKDATGGNAAVTVAPLTTVRQSLLGGIHTVGTIGIVAADTSTVPAATEQVTAILEQEHTPRKSGLQDDFTTTTFSSAQSAVAQHLVLLLFWFVLGVAVLGYLVGGAALGTVVLRRPAGDGRRPGWRPWTQSGALSLPAVAGGLALGCAGAKSAADLLASAAPQLGPPDLLCVPGVLAAAALGLVTGLAAGAVAGLVARRRTVQPG